MSAAIIRVVAAMVERDGCYLITQRRAGAVLPLCWEFPGGRVEAGESDEQALEREVRHRLGVSLTVGALVSFVRHAYERYTVDLHLYECWLADGQPARRNVADYAWAESADFEKYRFAPADEASVSQLLGLS